MLYSRGSERAGVSGLFALGVSDVDQRVSIAFEFIDKVLSVLDGEGFLGK